jgi:PAS domain S-box-containing protein
MKSNQITKAELNQAAEQIFISGSQGVLKRLAGNDEESSYFNLFKYAFDSGEDAVAIFDLDGKIDFVNTTFYGLFKYQSREELKGLKFSSFFPIREISLLANLLREPGAVKTLKLPEAQAISKDGKIMPVSLYAFEILNQAGQAIGLFCSIRDIAERKHAEQIAAKNEEQYRVLVENIHDVIYSLEPDGRISFMTPNAFDYVGYTHEDLVGHNILEFIHPEDVRRAALEFQKIVETGKEAPITFRLVTKNGAPMDAEARGEVILDQDGKE